MPEIYSQELSFKIIGAAFEVRNKLGRFLYENAYECALQYELKLNGVNSCRQYPIDVTYKGLKLDIAYRMDLLVEDCICIELKALPKMTMNEVSQCLSYLTFTNLRVGYLINFGAEDFCTGKLSDNDKVLDKGIYRLINPNYDPSLPPRIPRT